MEARRARVVASVGRFPSGNQNAVFLFVLADPSHNGNADGELKRADLKSTQIYKSIKIKLRAPHL